MPQVLNSSALVEVLSMRVERACRLKNFPTPGKFAVQLIFGKLCSISYFIQLLIHPSICRCDLSYLFVQVYLYDLGQGLAKLGGNPAFGQSLEGVRNDIFQNQLIKRIRFLWKISAWFLSTSGFPSLNYSCPGLALRPGGLRSRVLFHTRGHRQCRSGELPNLPCNYLYNMDKLQ